ncbi:MAG TPA: TIGR02270 family protein, partial [Archangium sp.]|nr:TIGR02270 family protein [Archangium sp.]
MMTPAISRAQWELFEEHLSEASFLLSQWQRALFSPGITLAELAGGIEERLLAHLDALVLGGPLVAEMMLQPGLEDADADVLTASALALLSTEEEAGEQLVLDGLENGTEETRPCLQHALELRISPRCIRHLLDLLTSPEAEVQAAALEVLGFWGVEPGPILNALLTHTSPDVRIAALKAARFTSEPVNSRKVSEALGSQHASVRDEALVTALILGMDSALPICRQLVTENHAGSSVAMLLLALGGDDSDLYRLLEVSEHPGVGSQVLWALGFSGRREAAERCLELLSHETLGKWAAESFCSITGLILEDRYLRAPPEEALDEAEGPPRPEDTLPLANSSAVQQWWQERRGQFQLGIRYLMGQPLTPSWLTEAYALVPMRRCHVLAQELALRSRGSLVIPSRAFSDRHRAEFQAARGILERLSLSRPFKEITATARHAVHRPQEELLSAGFRPKQPSRSLQGRLTITGLGMVSAIGDGVVASCAASRAGLIRISPLEDVQVWDPYEKQLEPSRGHSIPWVTEGFSGLGRLAALATQALVELRDQAKLDKRSRCALYLAAPSDFYRLRIEEMENLPPRHALRLAEYQQHLLPTILASAGLPITPKVQPLLFGELGFLQALQDSFRQFEAGHVDACIIGGVDSLVEPQLVDALDFLGLLKTPENPVGFLPGEAAAFMLVERGEVALRRGARPMAVLEASSVQAEPFHRLSRTPALGSSLAQCIRDTLVRLPDRGEQTRLVIASLNGDAYRASDWGHALVRLRADRLLNHASEWYPAASFGEIGAATGPTGVCMAVRGF